MNTNTKKLKIRFAIIEASYYAMFASFASFIGTFALHRGYSQSFISSSISCYLLFAFLGQFFWGSICDKIRSNKKIFLLLLTIAGVIQTALFFSPNKAVYILLYCMLGFLLGPGGTVLDTWLLRCMNNDVPVYGKVRSMGTAGYAVAILNMGFLAEHYGYWIMPTVSGGILIFTLIMSFTMPEAPFGQKRSEKVTFRDILSIFKDREFLILAVVMIIAGAAGSPLNNLKIVVLESVGGDISTQGIDSFMGCVTQFLIFFFAGIFAGIAPKKRLVLSSALITFGITVSYLATSPVMVILGTMTIFGTYGILTSASREIVKNNISYDYQTTANGIADSSYSFISGMLMMPFAGSISDAIGIRNTLGISILISVIPMIILMISFHKDKKNMQQMAKENI
ncbi:MAG: MFS transporter [Butyrivibrio sp.]|nr:MFS transporter [Butyrivibrio sp.]